MTQYLQCLKKNQEIQAKLKEGVFTNRERRDSIKEEEQLKSARALRRSECTSCILVCRFVYSEYLIS